MKQIFVILTITALLAGCYTNQAIIRETVGKGGGIVGVFRGDVQTHQVTVSDALISAGFEITTNNDGVWKITVKGGRR